jgi:hypothetical protein
MTASTADVTAPTARNAAFPEPGDKIVSASSAAYPLCGTRAITEAAKDDP